ncbi:L,D-transpeptidase family protein [Streptomyces formicae]|uniref:Secreted protein n=1 Tax=Streptomyces formicae TaxID=1616117 RepID=A0A291QE06_9ACTN|nr:L,D-transpeptidase [Streptomyces formicae]ATL29852.1 secreted protein [Streptomyces formicae]
MISKTAHRGLAVLLVLTAALPGASAAADPAPPRPAPAAPALVPGVPLAPPHPWQLDTPDQALPPHVYRPGAAEDAVEPMEAPAGTDALIEYVPPSEVVTKAAAAVCTKRAGPYQRQAERHLGRPVDGRQSAADCRAIRAFQRTQGIRPAIGFAGPVTWARMRLLDARENPTATKKCPTRAYRLACVDLSRQLMWVKKGEKVLLGPVPIRTGRAGYPTRTGWHKVYWKHKNHWSSLYETPMPYSQFFDGGQAFHAIYGNVYGPPGSRGCVNMRLADAKALWKTLLEGDRVYVWGRKPGT